MQMHRSEADLKLSQKRDKQLQGWLTAGERPIRSQAEERRAGVSEEKFVYIIFFVCVPPFPPAVTWRLC